MTDVLEQGTSPLPYLKKLSIEAGFTADISKNAEQIYSSTIISLRAELICLAGCFLLRYCNITNPFSYKMDTSLF